MLEKKIEGDITRRSRKEREGSRRGRGKREDKVSAFFELLGDGVEVTRASGPPRNPFRPDSVNPAPMIRYLMFHLALNLNVVECMSTHHLAPTPPVYCFQSEEKTAPSLQSWSRCKPQGIESSNLDTSSYLRKSKCNGNL